jgi:hypothetical protein
MSLGLSVNIYLDTREDAPWVPFVVITLTLGYESVLCFVVAFHMFVDLDFTFTAESNTLLCVSFGLVEVWAIFTYLISDAWIWLVLINFFLGLLGYMFFLYTRWKKSK